MSIEAMKEALDVLKDHRKRAANIFTSRAMSRCKNAINELRFAIREAEMQAPFVYIKDDGTRAKLIWASEKVNGDGCQYEALYTEPVHVRDILKSLIDENTKYRRKWVGLTEEDLASCKSDEFVVFARAIEAKLKEKNS